MKVVMQFIQEGQSRKIAGFQPETASMLSVRLRADKRSSSAPAKRFAGDRRANEGASSGMSGVVGTVEPLPLKRDCGR